MYLYSCDNVFCRVVAYGACKPYGIYRTGTPVPVRVLVPLLEPVLSTGTPVHGYGVLVVEQRRMGVYRYGTGMHTVYCTRILVLYTFINTNVWCL